MIRTHALSLLGEPALPRGFPHWPWVNPDAPKVSALGRRLAISGTRRLIASKRSRSSVSPARRAMAIRCGMALVEPPKPIAAVTALSMLPWVSIAAGVRSSHTIPTMRRPHSVAMRGWLASAAGIAEAPGRVKPSASTASIIVAAVPAVMQVPKERAMPASIAFHCASVMFPARSSAWYFHTSEPLPSGLPRQLPRSIGPAGMKIAGSPALIAPITSAGGVLSQPPSSTRPSTGWLRASSSVSIASRLR